MKCQDLFSLKNEKKKKKFVCRLLQILLGALRVKVGSLYIVHSVTKDVLLSVFLIHIPDLKV